MIDELSKRRAAKKILNSGKANLNQKIRAALSEMLLEEFFSQCEERDLGTKEQALESISRAWVAAKFGSDE